MRIIEGEINPLTDFASASMLLCLDTKQLLAWVDQLIWRVDGSFEYQQGDKGSEEYKWAAATSWGSVTRKR